MAEIISITAREIYDSRATPTVEACVTLSSGIKACAAVPSGASTGSQEALEKRDGTERLNGKGVQKAVAAVNDVIAPALFGFPASQQEKLDRLLCTLDGTENKTNFGANAILAVSLAAARAAAAHNGQTLAQHIYGLFSGPQPMLPVPLLNVINGGAHANNTISVQEFMVVPHGAPDFATSLEMGVEVYHQLKHKLHRKGLSTTVGDEGGFAPNFSSVEDVLDILCTAIDSVGYKLGTECSLALDVAASEFYGNGIYALSEHLHLTAQELIDCYKNWCKAYPIVSIEDGMAEKDYAGWATLTQELGSTVQLVGDDIFVTNPKLIEKGVGENLANATLIKLNQIGTLSETLAAIRLTQKAGWGVVVSHRSGETQDDFIADLAVGTGAGQIKTGAPARGERATKYNRLLELAKIHSGAGFAGKTLFS